MNSRWLWFDYVDADLPLTRAQRRAVWRRVKSMRRGWRWGLNRWDLIEHASLALGVAGYWFLWWLWVGFNPGMRTLWALLFYFVFLWPLMAVLMRHTRRPWVLRAVRESGYDVCVECGYWLRGLSDEVKNCPECGAEREPTTPRQEPTT